MSLIAAVSDGYAGVEDGIYRSATSLIIVAMCDDNAGEENGLYR